MRKVIVNNIVSLDGYFADETGNPLALNMDAAFDRGNLESIEAEIKRLFDEDLTDMVAEGLADRWKTVDHLMKLAYRLARFRWDISLASAEHDGDDYRGADAD